MKGRKSKNHGRVPRSRSRQIDLHLAVAGALLSPGKTRTLPELAAWAGCSKQAIALIEKKAIDKFRRALNRATDTLKEELHSETMER
jgi:hypothetical protein